MVLCPGICSSGSILGPSARPGHCPGGGQGDLTGSVRYSVSRKGRERITARIENTGQNEHRHQWTDTNHRVQSYLLLAFGAVPYRTLYAGYGLAGAPLAAALVPLPGECSRLRDRLEQIA